MNKQHTQGPWIVGEGGVGELRVFPMIESRLPVAIVPNCHGGNVRENAALIAAAPKLLKVLEELIAVCRPDIDTLEAFANARAAIAEAKGN